MEQHPKAAVTNHLQNKVKQTYSKIGLFFGHCFVGIVGIGYFTYKTFLNRHQSVYDKGTKSFKTKSPLFRNLCKTIGWTSLFFISSGFILNSLRSTKALYSQALQHQKGYINTIKVDPLFQDYYIFQTMQYFGISQQLIKKTHAQLQKIKDKIQINKDMLEDEKLSIDKQLIKMALMRQNLQRKTQKEEVKKN